MDTLRRTLCTLPLLLLALAALPLARPRGQQFPQRPPQQPAQPTFRTRVELVQVDVIATDARGELVKDLEKEDFEVLEDGKPQQVASFQLIDVPVRAESGQTFSLVPPDVRSNVADVSGRVYLLVLDDLRTKVDDLMYARRVAGKFIREYLQPGDIAAITFTSGRRNISQEFTSDRRLLLAAVDRFMPFLPAAGSGEVVPAGRVGEAAEQGSIRGVFSTLTALANNLAGVGGGRKACVYLGPGFPVRQATGSVTLTPGEYRDLAAVANRSNISFYTIDPAGLAPLAEAAAASGALPDPAAAVDAIDALHEGLAWLAADTGGFAVAGSNNFDRAFDRIRRETSSYYLLGYYPASPGKEGSIHGIRVRVRRPGVMVRARPGYSIPKASSRPSTTLKAKNLPERLLAALDSPLPSAALRFSVSTATFRGAARWSTVVIEVEGADLDTSGKGALDVGVIAVDRLGNVKGHDERRVDLRMDAGALAQVKQFGLRVHARVPLEGDARALRVAVADAASNRVGSLTVDIDDPDADKEPEVLTQVLLTHSAAGRVPTSNADEELKRVLGGPASTRREFSAGTSIAWLAELYQAKNRRTDVRVTTTITTTDGRRVFGQQEPRTASEPRSPRGGVDVVGRAPLRDVAPGPYVLRIEALAVGEKKPAVREVPFTVR